MQRIWKLLSKHRETILYIVFGVLTTLVNIAAYYVLTRWLAADAAIAAAVAWLLSVLFAYGTNRKWVFESRANGLRAVLAEMIAFFAARLATGLMDIGIMALFVDALHWPDMPVKIASNVLVVILNYAFSKLIVFRKGSRTDERK